MHEQTMEFSVQHDKEAELKKTLTIIYDALKEKGYNPINQIVGYILSEDPTYITTYNNARSLIRHIDRDELLQALVLLSVSSLAQRPALAAVWRRLLLTIRSSRRPSTRKRSVRVRSRAWLLRNLPTTALAVQL